MVEPEDAMSLLREIRDSAARHQQYIEERDRKQNEYLQSETERVQRIEKLQERAKMPAKLSVEMPDDLKSMFDSVGAQLEEFRAQASEGVEVDFGLPANLKNVFQQFEGVSLEAVDNIGTLSTKRFSIWPNPHPLRLPKSRWSIRNALQIMPKLIPRWLSKWIGQLTAKQPHWNVRKRRLRNPQEA